MWKKIRPMLPHGAILLANMYIVFFLIDRVNTSMNFIDNGLTKGLLAAMCVIAICDVLLPSLRARGSTKTGKTIQKKSPDRADATNRGAATSSHKPTQAASGRAAGNGGDVK